MRRPRPRAAAPRALRGATVACRGRRRRYTPPTPYTQSRSAASPVGACRSTRCLTAGPEAPKRRTPRVQPHPWVGKGPPTTHCRRYQETGDEIEPIWWQLFTSVTAAPPEAMRAAEPRCGTPPTDASCRAAVGFVRRVYRRRVSGQAAAASTTPRCGAVDAQACTTATAAGRRDAGSRGPAQTTSSAGQPEQA